MLSKSFNTPKRILVTGAGGAAAVSFIGSILKYLQDYELFAVDMDIHAAGLYLLPESHRALVPAGDSDLFIKQLLLLCKRWKIDAIVPTVETEMGTLSAKRSLFNNLGIEVMMSGAHCIDLALDKHKLMQACQKHMNLAQFMLWNEANKARFIQKPWAFPLILKPISGRGSQDIHKIENASQLLSFTANGQYVLQEYLQGTEYSVDVLLGKKSQVLSSVVRSRLKIDSGIAVAAQTVQDEELQKLAEQVCSIVKAQYVVNVQFKRDSQSRPKLLEINPRFPGTMPLTVASGIDMPYLALQILFDRKVSIPKTYKDIYMVRTWQEHFVEKKPMLISKQKHATLKTCDTAQALQASIIRIIRSF